MSEFSGKVTKTEEKDRKDGAKGRKKQPPTLDGARCKKRKCLRGKKQRINRTNSTEAFIIRPL